MMTSAEIRKEFLQFFAEKKHKIVPSASIVVKNDPTLLFTNAGMNQFKDYFLGNRKPEHTRIADTQKCLRVSGKHNDLEEVGVDTYHHTMFEMLGNWSFGDYFKAEAIAWSWELLTEVYKLDKDRLYVTVFEGSETEGLPKDEEAYNEWKKVISEDRILLGNKKDNFWEMGDTGPCGPCTEIHYDSRSNAEREQVDGKKLVNADDPQVIEMWNNVFMEFNRIWNPEKSGGSELLMWEKEHAYLVLSTDKKLNKEFKQGRENKHRELTLLIPLTEKHVDTGMGLERLVRVIQGENSNYDTDLFRGTIAAVEKIVGLKYNLPSAYPSGHSHTEAKMDTAFRVIADHIRAIVFTIADGQLPSNAGAGYVIRRILRRAVRYYYSWLGYNQPLLFKLVPLLAKQFENVFPELFSQLEFVTNVVKEEEQGFLRTLEKGLEKIEAIMDAASGNIINGKSAFELFDTYGFPIDLTRLIAGENNLKVDEQAFEAEMQQQKNRSRAAATINSEDWILLNEDSASEFIGYDMLQVKSKVVKYRKVTAKGKEAYQWVLYATPFYAESGGQVGDRGELIFENQVIDVFDTKKENNLTIHFTERLPEEIDGDVIAKVNRSLRKNTEIHHTATHLLHAALRQLLGTHVAQKGSLVNAEHLRFDFSHFGKVTDEDIDKIEAVVNEKIRENIPVVIKEMTKQEAVEMGAMALFGEKYGDVVRVVIIDPKYSIELCGGTHVLHTGELGFLKIKHESAVAAGVRRIEAVSGKAAEDWVSDKLREFNFAKALLNSPQLLTKGIEILLNEQNELKKKLESLQAKLVNRMELELLQKAIKVNNIPFIGETIEISSLEALKKLRVDLNNKLNGAVVLCATINGKAEVVIALSEMLVAKKGLDADKIIQEQVKSLIKGGGRGSKTMAAAGGKDSSYFTPIIEKVKALL